MPCAFGLAALVVALGGCGGSDSAPDAPSMLVTDVARPATIATPAAAASPAGAEARREPASAEATSHAGGVSMRSLRDALAPLAADGISVAVDPSIAGAAVAGDNIGRGVKGDALVALLRGFDVVLLYGGVAGSPSTLKAVWVDAPGRAAERMAARDADASRSDERQVPLPTDPAARAERLERDLASPDAALRRQALASSFALRTALPEHALLQTARADSDSDLRRVALQALARHPSADEAIVRAAVQAALADRDADVRGAAQELLEQLDLAALPAESVPPPTASP